MVNTKAWLGSVMVLDQDDVVLLEDIYQKYGKEAYKEVFYKLIGNKY